MSLRSLKSGRGQRRSSRKKLPPFRKFDLAFDAGDEAPLHCVTCDKIFISMTLRSFESHVKKCKKESQNLRKRFMCEFCSKRYIRATFFVKHMANKHSINVIGEDEGQVDKNPSPQEPPSSKTEIAEVPDANYPTVNIPRPFVHFSPGGENSGIVPPQGISGPFIFFGFILPASANGHFNGVNMQAFPFLPNPFGGMQSTQGGNMWG